MRGAPKLLSRCVLHTVNSEDGHRNTYCMTRHARVAKPPVFGPSTPSMGCRARVHANRPDRISWYCCLSIPILTAHASPPSFAQDTFGATFAPWTSIPAPARLRPFAAVARMPPPATCFPTRAIRESALSGLFLYFSCLTEAHELLHHFATVDGAYWHGIMHRMEGDAYQRRLLVPPRWSASGVSRAAPGGRAIWAIRKAKIGTRFALFGSAKPSEIGAANRTTDPGEGIQLAEWRLLFDYCATVSTSAIHPKGGGALKKIILPLLLILALLGGAWWIYQMKSEPSVSAIRQSGRVRRFPIISRPTAKSSL